MRVSNASARSSGRYSPSFIAEKERPQSLSTLHFATSLRKSQAVKNSASPEAHAIWRTE